MKLFRVLIPVACAAVLAAACQNKPDVEAEGQKYLQRARISLQNGATKDAKALIDSLRVRCPMALNAREEGIILLDSINLVESKRQLDSMDCFLQTATLTRLGKDTMDFKRDELNQKVRFFMKKLSHDQQNKKQH
jgi:hypothetical protein